MGTLPTTLGPYVIIRQLGEGGMGAVYEAVDQKSEKRIALKVLLPEYARNKEVAERLFREARALGRLRHAGIVEVLDYGEMPDGTAYLAMEYIRGQTLSDWHSRRPGPVLAPLALRLGEQIASALATAHEKGIVHRDVKPSNVMVLEDPTDPAGPRVKLLDFGIAKLAHDTRGQKAKTATNLVMGTPYYMSPEQCQGAGYVDAKSDVYGLGVMLFELLSGRLPFDGEGSGQLLALHMFKEPPNLREVAPQVPGGLSDLVHTLLAKEKAHRPSMAELAAELGRMLQVGGAPSTSPLAMTLLSAKFNASRTGRPDTTLGASPSQSQFLGRRRSFIGLVATGALALVTTTALWIRRPQTAMAPPASNPHPSAPVQLPTAAIRWIVTSEPSGADVVRAADDKVLGQTPWSVEQPAGVGTAELRLRLSGYNEQQVSLERQMSQKVHLNLTPLPVTKAMRPTNPRIRSAPKPPVQKNQTKKLGGFEYEQ